MNGVVQQELQQSLQQELLQHSEVCDTQGTPGMPEPFADKNRS